MLNLLVKYCNTLFSIGINGLRVGGVTRFQMPVNTGLGFFVTELILTNVCSDVVGFVSKLGLQLMETSDSIWFVSVREIEHLSSCC